MNTFLSFKNLCSALLIMLFMTPSANAQIWKKIKKSAERTVERKLERKTEKETGKMMDSILDPSQKSPTNKNPTNEPGSTVGNQASTPDNDSEPKNISDDLEVYSKFDFVPGDKVLFYDDFSQDFVGDFPSKWNTNGSGEVVKMNNIEGSWFELQPSYSTYYVPDLNGLPEDYTIEFDILTLGLDNGTSSGSHLRIHLSDNNNLNERADNRIVATIPINFRNNHVSAHNRFNGERGSINAKVAGNIKDELQNQPHVAIAVTKNRFRLWINERKFLDIPRMIEVPNVLNHIKFNLIGLKKETERLFINNLRIADGGEDLRRTLLTEGKISTNGILFDSGSANIKPQSLGIVLQISQVLLQDENMKLNIIGHTDADGNSDTNLTLSKQRAESVKNALINLYNIPADRLQTDGKGASAPVADNDTAEGKAQNRRVEFIKI
ncbi:OmpA family protein [Gelidibacter maritimus]|uniref:OmpA family protein n=1 Tax=Gelidibacter maritimus TaxID=2761487 RepID=A0A7W2M7E1_9FLAO|nr:OmpA family protein [Gelidibacter maritimus]MBA6154054.1 OmpA family protein [Gelidibacter maritimus]